MRYGSGQDNRSAMVAPLPYLVVAAVFVKQGDDGLDVASLYDVQRLRALHQDAVQHLQDACRGPGDAC